MTTTKRYRIGEIADELGVTTRTVRYYEEIGLLQPSGHSPGGSRRYTDEDLARLLRIRELQAIMGFNLDEIREILATDDRLDEIRSEYHEPVSGPRRQQFLLEAALLRARTQEQVRAKIATLESFEAELEERAAHYRTLAKDMGFDLDAAIRAAIETS